MIPHEAFDLYRHEYLALVTFWHRQRTTTGIFLGVSDSPRCIYFCTWNGRLEDQPPPPFGYEAMFGLFSWKCTESSGGDGGGGGGGRGMVKLLACWVGIWQLIFQPSMVRDGRIRIQF